MRHILVTGGAGYVGAHACKALATAGLVPVAFDNLGAGWSDAVKFGPFERGDLLDRDRIDEVFRRYTPEAVMHFAALTGVGESMRKPGLYRRNNVDGSLNLIKAAVSADCRNFVFSSTCAIYGDQGGAVLDEQSIQAPISPYAASKRMVEDMLGDFGASDGLRHVIFRYFNVAGADPDAEVGEFHRPETHLIPLILDAMTGNRPALTVHGTDYGTPDGTCIRDYVHVMDLVDAHILGLDRLRNGGGSRVFNLGTGRGFTVRQVSDHCQAVTGRAVTLTEGPRREGDCARLVSGGARATQELGWTPHRSTLPTMIADAWRWHRTGHYDQ